MINNTEKIKILNEKIDTVSIIINNLLYGINNIPWDISKGNDFREQELSEYILRKNALEQELLTIQDSDII